MKSELKSAVTAWLTVNNSTQKDLAKQASVSQSTVSRAANKNWVSPSKQIRALCKFLGVSIDKADPRECSELMNILSEMWDGTESGEQSLIKLLKSIQAYKM